MQKYIEILENLKNESQYRKISVLDKKIGKSIIIDGQEFLNLSSNDYLGMGSNEKIQKSFLKNLNECSFGSTSARLLTGNSTYHDRVEFLLKRMFEKEAALVFNSGYHANVGIVQALTQRGCAIFCDKLNHASIIDGMRLADGDFYRYKHLDYTHLEQLLLKNSSKYDEIIIISESVFSMDGDVADLKKLVELKNRYNAILIVDEAHAFGVFGKNGLGIAQHQNVLSEIDLIVATFGKSVGSIGAFCVGSQVLIDYLINKARSFIFSTALPPINMAWTAFVLESQWQNARREHLLNVSNELRTSLKALNIEILGNSQIIPIIVGDNEKAVLLSEKLKAEGFLALPIRPPTVPQGQSRVRISLTSDIELSDIEKLPHVIANFLS